PCSGPRGGAGSAAAARPASGRGTATAFNVGLAASTRAIAASASSAAVTSPAATRSRSATASSHRGSSSDTLRSLDLPARLGRRAQVVLRPPVDVVLGDLVRQPHDPAVAVVALELERELDRAGDPLGMERAAEQPV